MSRSTIRPIDVAIIGGGLPGLVLAVGLQKYPHLNVQVYEAARAFSEIGFGVSIGPNAQRAMEMIDPRIKDGFDRRAAFSEDPPDENGEYSWMTMRKGQEPDLGELVMEFRNPMRGGAIHRAHFLDELVKLLDPGRAHYGKRLDRIEDPISKGQPSTLHFRDGTQVTADLIVGADGVHSVVRKHILDENNPAGRARYTGCVSYRGRVPIEVAEEKLGSIRHNLASYSGKGGAVTPFKLPGLPLFFISVTVFNHRTYPRHCVVAILANGVAAALENPTAGDIEAVKAQFADWGDYCRKCVELLPSDGSVLAWPIWEMPPAPTFYNGKVAVIGDAAHASTPFQGHGAGQGIEDALILEKLLGKYLAPDNSKSFNLVQYTIPQILQTYDTVRRFRAEKVVSFSREAGQVMGCIHPEVGNGAREMGDWLLAGGYRWVYEHDMQQYVADACRIFEAMA